MSKLMSIEKFKSHREVRDRCIELIKNKQIVCQTIKDFADFGIDYLVYFNLEHDYIYQDLDKTSDSYGLWKVKRKKYFE